MGERSVEVAALVGNLRHAFLVGVVVDGLHEGKASGDHEYDDAQVFGKGEQKTAEVVALDGGVTLVQGEGAAQARDNVCDIVAPVGAHLVFGEKSGVDGFAQEHGDDHAAVGAHHVAEDDGGVDGQIQGMEAEGVAGVCGLAVGGGSEGGGEPPVVVLLQERLHERAQPGELGLERLPLLGCKNLTHSEL